MVMSQVLHGGTENFKRVKHGLADVVRRELDIDLDKELQESVWVRGAHPRAAPVRR
jgi:ribonuclease D